MSVKTGKRPSGAENRKRRSAKLEAALAESGQLQRNYIERFGRAPADPSELMSWLAKVGGVLVEEALSIPDQRERHKAVANLYAKIGLVSSKSQFAGRVESIERKLADLAGPKSHIEATAVGVPVETTVIPARGTPLWNAWQARGALPSDGANVVEAPETSRAYRALADKEPT